MTARPPPAPPLPSPKSSHAKEVRHLTTGIKQIRKQLEFELVGAIESGDTSLVRRLIERGARLDCVVQWALSPLLLAIQEGQVGVAELLVELGADAEGMDKLARQWRPLHAAANHGMTKLAAMLLDHSAQVDTVDGCGMTPLQLACYHGHRDLVKLLLAHQANIHLSDFVQRSPLHRAMEGGHVEVAKLLLDHGCCINSVDKYGWSALYHCVVFNDVDGARFLIERGIELNTRDTFGNTPLHKACDLFKARDIRIVTSTSVDFIHRCRRIISPQIRQQIANQDLGRTSHLQMVELLVDAGADLDVVDFYGHSAVELSVDFAVTARLVLSGARITADMLESQVTQNAMEEYDVPFADPLQPGQFIPGEADAGLPYSNKYWLYHYPPWLEEQYHAQFTLVRQCRKAVRRFLARTRDIRSSVDKLPLPTRLKDFLLVKEDLPC